LTVTTQAEDRGPALIQGSSLVMLNGQRPMKVYVLTEESLDTIGQLDFYLSVWIAIASCLLSFAAAIWLSVSLAGPDVPTYTAAIWDVLKWLFSVLGALFLVLAISSHFKKIKKVDQIKKETIHKQT